jgi:hypothetical protein
LSSFTFACEPPSEARKLFTALRARPAGAFDAAGALARSDAKAVLVLTRTVFGDDPVDLFGRDLILVTVHITGHYFVFALHMPTMKFGCDRC